ncbi:AMIN-like domain-containing (lipo)protein [Micromonospora siamensis]|uniref:AMIN-like domain-containing protein n=1 Tax=Micromonospora siamensis TaxID=299152 RepID=A0A1C5JAI7_9ACTN|nr:hypothetical protein [Micromonospora siamensis]SCG67169.1 hypothetical protein GA0074704_4262 [Micromonospora siamensis]
MTDRRVPLLLSLVVLLAAACSADPDGTASAPGTPAVSGTSATAPTAAATATGRAPSAPVLPTSAASRPAPAAGDWRVTYGWAVPTTPARVDHVVRPPVTPEPGLPLSTLTGVRVGDHPAEGYSRISFVFRGPTPGYEVAYVPQVTTDGSGTPVRLPGAAFLSVAFRSAQAHDAHGASTVTTAPPAAIGFPTLRGWADAGDFEGQVSFGLGLTRAVSVRLAESTGADGGHVVSVDVRRG